jgi:hypothetical protein
MVLLGYALCANARGAKDAAPMEAVVKSSWRRVVEIMWVSVFILS